MKKSRNNPDLSATHLADFPKSRGQVFLEKVLLVICLCVIALRATYTEGLGIPLVTQTINIGDNMHSLAISAVLILSFAIWLIWNFCSGRCSYRFSALESGLLIFCIAACITGFVASNKRAAITNIATLLAPLFMAVLLVQILDSRVKIKLLLVVIASLGIVAAYECFQQFFATNQIMIEEYEAAPGLVIGPLGIQPGSFNHMMFEHRLYSKDVRGFFTTGNSAGSFAILAFSAVFILLTYKFKNRKSLASPFIALATGLLALVAILFGLALTRSKGAIGSLLFASIVFVIWLRFGDWLKAHRKKIFIICVLLILAAGYVTVWFGLKHDRLPSGNSMLVRWQYWRASAKLYADHFLTGVGPGNFNYFYPHYKPASAPETVSDPHNFILSVLTQYGPLGLVGFLALILIPLGRLFSNPTNNLAKPHQLNGEIKKLAIICPIVISIVLLLIRPIISPADLGKNLYVMIYMVFSLYLAPVVAFAVGFWLLTTGEKKLRDSRYAIYSTNTIAALFCACLAVLLHSLVDFAIFEPGVFTAFWAIVAALIALDFNRKAHQPMIFKPTALAKILIVVCALLMLWGYFHYAFWPVAKATIITKRAFKQREYPHQFLEQAAGADPLDPTASNLNGRFYLLHYENTGQNQPELLINAEDCFQRAIPLNPADYKNYEKLSEVYTLLAEASSQHAKTGWLEKALNAEQNAILRYPGSDRIHFDLAQIAEQLGDTDCAIEHYKRAIEIEDGYRLQFQVMYPGRKIFSRLGWKKYQTAKEKISQLSENPTP